MSTLHSHAANATPSAFYRSKLQSIQLQIHSMECHQRALLFVIALLLLTGILIGGYSWKAASAIPVAAAVFLLRRLFSLRRGLSAHFRLSDWYERGIARLEGKWQGQGRSGEEFSREGHPYQADLDILGGGSIFELLATSRSAAGAERLALYLLDPPAIAFARARQAAVAELKPQTDLRESLALAGRYAFQDCDPRVLRDWLNASAFEVPIVVPAFLLASSACLFVIGVLTLIGFLAWHSAFPFLLPLLTIHAWLGRVFMRRVRPELGNIASLSGELAILTDGLAVMRSQTFDSEMLNALVVSIDASAISDMSALQRLAGACEQRRKDVLYQFSLFLCLGTQLAFAIGRWRRKHGAELGRWLDAWAEFEAINALACYAYEHPDHVFPEIVDGVTLLHAEGLAHPLLPASTCVTNNLHLDNETLFHLVTGSNMAGKSTWLRAVGLTAVLAAAGAPVRATKVRTSLFTVSASISIVDSLATGKSKFLAEVERLRTTIHAARHHAPVLFLIDEVLSGTNSADRRQVVESVLGVLVSAEAIGLFSTHDSALVALGEDPRLRGRNVHMSSQDPEDPLDFDYRVKPGAVKDANALAICRMVGIGSWPSKPRSREIT